VALPDPQTLTPRQRRTLSMRVQVLSDIEPWPDLKYFNSAPCERHAPVLDPLCSRCGIRLRRHQRIGAAWMYLGLPGLLSDTVGSGKTAQVLSVLAMAKEHGELSYDNRAVIVCKAAAVHDPWGNELRRLTPGLDVFIADGDPKERIAGYMGNWEVVVVSDRTFAPARGKHKSRDGDIEYLYDFPVGILVYDDVDAMRNHTTKTSWAINRLANKPDCTRVNGVHATPMQKRLPELWSFLQPVGGTQVLGPITRVQSRYVAQRRKYIWKADPKDPQGRRRIKTPVTVDTGLTDRPERVREFRSLIRPLVLRRTAADFDDVEMPAVQVDPVFLDLHPRQRERYEELRTGVLRRLKADGEEITQAEAAAAFIRGWQICSGLASLDEGPGTDVSVKMDWTMDALTGDLSEDKAVVFIYFKNNVRAFSQRLEEAGIGHVLFWSAETDKRVRRDRLVRFREDPDCRVLVGTTTIEASLNLQVAPHLIAVDTILNPARMEQLVGRVRRQGSPFNTVFFHHLLAQGTQEDGYLPLLRREQATADIVWGERSEIFQALTPRQLMRLVATGQAIAA
jgi:SNF2 family DNA or RNA helicase